MNSMVCSVTAYLAYFRNSLCDSSVFSSDHCTNGLLDYCHNLNNKNFTQAL